jgi:hypothetical protein
MHSTLPGQPTAIQFSPPTLIFNFYREEFLKHREYLQLQRESYSERAVASAEAALCRVLGQLDRLCTCHDGVEVVSRLLRSFDVVTGVSACCCLKKSH